ncbi:hypothetical protein FDP41_011190 [Naegleria fowleri]|uniref:RGS domain-containing protein n=1 Tax=Naegleria fowleri TaxID=5763 RepID=A0A6A5BZN6_NAEFO|nr:uncharacterized protein FDP41_011190 [Naegleria fowleri]KAF0982727.1 hypothetical protein FDP41_011190 [Naegleria fowleri]
MHHSDEGGLSMLPPTTTTTTTNDDKFSTIFNVYEIQQYSLHNKLFFEKFNSLVSDFVILETPVNISNASQLQGCNPILFQLGNFSRDGAVLTASGCPETWLSFSFSLFFLLCYLMLLVLCCLGLIWKRKSRHVQSRGMVYMVLTLVASSFIVILSCLRYIIGRKNYPCFIYAISYFVLPPALILPSIFRCFRLYLMHVLNLNKTNLVFVKDYDRSMNFDAGAVNANLQLCTHSSVEFQSDPRKNLKHEFVTPQQQQQTNQEKRKVHSTNTGIFTTRGVFQDVEFQVQLSHGWSGHILLHSCGDYIVCIVSNICTRHLVYLERNSNTHWTQIVCHHFVCCFGFVPIFSKLLDFFIPYGYVLLVYSCCEIIVSVLLPVLYSIVMDARQKRGNSPEHASFNPSEESGLEQCLKQKKTFNTILEFARKSFCPEPVLCYRDIERFTKTTNSKNRRKLAPHIANTYLKQNSPLQLNYPKVNEAFHECMAVIHRCSDNGTIIPSDLFKNIQLHCLNDMTDIFERLKRQDRDIKEVVHQWNLSSLAKPVQTNGQ